MQGSETSQKHGKPYWLSSEYAKEYIRNVKYSTIRKVYDIVCKNIISRYLRDIEAGKCLDVGCGPGVYGLFILEHKFSKEVIFLDINAYMLKYVKSMLGKYYVFSHIIHADINYMPFRSNVFDVVLAEGDSLTQRQDRESVAKGLNEICRILKTKGLLLGSISNMYSRIIAKTITMDSIEGINEVLEMIKNRELVVRKLGYEESKIQLYYVNEFKKLLEDIGFKNAKLNPLIVLTTTMPKDLIEKHFSRIAETELKLSHDPNLLPLALRIHFACNKA